MTPAEGFVPFIGMSNVLSEAKRQQVIAFNTEREKAMSKQLVFAFVLKIAGLPFVPSPHPTRSSRAPARVLHALAMLVEW